MYVKVLFLLCAYIAITNADTESDEAKYIDLLPEEEKQEFLNRITKRIVAEIRSHNHSDKTSVEVSDESLNENSAFVQKIMEEESETLKNNRRHESGTKTGNTENEDDIEIKIKPLQKQDNEVQGITEALDLVLIENKKRTKKDTHENGKQMSIENNENKEDIVTQIPVSIAYDYGSNSSKATTEKKAVGDDVLNENLEESKLEVKGLNILKSGTESQFSYDSLNKNLNTGTAVLKFKSKEAKSEEVSETGDINNTQKPYFDIEVKRTTKIFVTPQSNIDDYQNQDKNIHNDIKVYVKNDTFVNKPSETTRKDIIEDFTPTTLQSPVNEQFEMHVESSTDNVINILPNGTEIDLLTTSNNVLVENVTSKYINPSNSSYLSAENKHFLGDMSDKNINYTTERINEVVLENETKDSLKLVTPSIDFRIELNSNFTNKHSAEILLPTITTSEKPVYDDNIKFKDSTKTVGAKHVREDNKSRNSVNAKSNLRTGSSYVQVARPEYDDWMHLKSKNSDKHYHVYEISNKKPPFKPSERINFDLIEEPHYVPVYNYAPENAFYSAYNHFGPNYNGNGKLFQSDGPTYDHNGANEKLNIRNIIPDYFKGQRNFKPYFPNNVYHRPRSVAYYNNIVPAVKEKFPVINFNPNDYLDMDYYLGRSNDAPENIYSEHLTAKDNSVDVIDPDPGTMQYNIKDNIEDIRHRLYKQKYGQRKDARETQETNGQKAKTGVPKQKEILNPMLRGLDKTLLIFLPGKGISDRKKNDFSDKNIAVDYYFSRMNSEELPLYNENKSKSLVGKLQNKVPNKVNKSNTKNIRINTKERKDEIVQEKRLEIPLKQDNVLKIDIGVRNGNKVNVIFKNVKKNERNEFDDYLNAYLNVLKDMIEHDSKGLLLYDWLGSTIDIQSAIRKLLDLINNLKATEQVHYSDYQLLKYILNVYQSSNELIKDARSSKIMNKGNKISESPIKRKVPRVLKDKMNSYGDRLVDNLDKVLKYVKDIQGPSTNMNDDVIDEFENFLNELKTDLYEIHEAIRQIATVTKFHRQRWFHDLKALFLTPVNRKVSLSLLLHLACAKFFGLIEESSGRGLEDNFVIFTQKHGSEVAATRDELVLILRLLNEIKRLKN